MIRGSNVEFRFKLPYPFSELATVNVVFWQDGYDGPSPGRPLPIKKNKNHCRVGRNDTELSVVLQREETLRFTDKRKGKVQLFAETFSGIDVCGLEQLFPVYPSKDGDEFTGGVIESPDGDYLVLFDGRPI